MFHVCASVCVQANAGSVMPKAIQTLSKMTHMRRVMCVQ